VFAVRNLNFVVRCSLERDDGGEVRLSKIEQIIEECRFGIHDLSAVELDATTHLPRFNMPLELGLFLGCKRFGANNQHKKTSLILDKDRYRYQAFMSDIAGQDIHAHNSDPERAIHAVRDWLAAASKGKVLPGGHEIVDHHRRFQAKLPKICADLKLQPSTLTFRDLSAIITNWLPRRR
jgi:hypothetical protein